MEILPESEMIEMVQQKLDGESYQQIRSQLAAKGYTEEEIKSIIRKVDEKVLLAVTGLKQQDRARRWYRSGFVLAVIGLAIAIAFNAGYILHTMPRWLVYSPFLIGIVIMFYGRMQQRKPTTTDEKGPGPIRSRRPYK